MHRKLSSSINIITIIYREKASICSDLATNMCATDDIAFTSLHPDNQSMLMCFCPACIIMNNDNDEDAKPQALFCRLGWFFSWSDSHSNEACSSPSTIARSS